MLNDGIGQQMPVCRCMKWWFFANARRQLSLTMEPREQQRILRELGDAAMGEHGQWILRLRERPISTVG